MGCVGLFLLLMLSQRAGDPLLDRHAWRQVDTASFARGLALGEFDVLHPRFVAVYPDRYGLDGAVETEFNLYPLIVSWVYRLLGVREILARGVSIAFSLGTALWVYLLGAEHYGRRAGALAALSLGLSPLYVFYGRTVQPDATALFFSVGALCLFSRWLGREERAAWVTFGASALCASLAFLTKVTALYMGMPLLVAALAKYGRRAWREWRLWLYLAIALLPAALYYWHAHGLYSETGLTVYGISGGWPGSGKFDTLGQLASPEFYRVMFARLRGLILGRYGLALFALGLVLHTPGRRDTIPYVWLASVGLFILGVAQGNRQHEYYQLPLVPVAALFIGKALSLLLDPQALRLDLHLVGRRAGPLLALALVLLSYRGAKAQLEPLYAQTPVLLEVAGAAEAHTPEGQPVAILHDWARVPEVFYYAHRRGWALWLERTAEGEYGQLIVAERVRTAEGWRIDEALESDIDRLELLRAQGASSLVVCLERGTTDAFRRSPIGQQLLARYPLIAQDEHWLVLRLVDGPPAAQDTQRT